MSQEFLTKSRYELKILFPLSLIALCFWLIAIHVNVYQWILGGAIFEILWLPAILLLFGLPILAFYYWYQIHFKIKSNYFYFFIWTLIVALTVYFLGNK